MSANSIIATLRRENDRLQEENRQLQIKAGGLHRWIDAVGFTNKCISGCSWGTDGHYSHHPYCGWLVEARAAQERKTG